MARNLFAGMFFNPKRYDLSPVGRLKLNKKLNLDIQLEKTTLTAQDVVEVIRYLVNLRTGKGEVDDIDHLGNRFTITIRRLDTARLEQLKILLRNRTGLLVPNYFDSQRFGSLRIANEFLAVKLSRGEYEAVLRVMLTGHIVSSGAERRK
jgi:tRNA(Glu) U13 pseudouridine synthase TruD